MRSMTGIGTAESRGDDVLVRARIRSVNGRFLKVQCRVPDVLADKAADIEAAVRRVAARGSVTVRIRVRETSAGATGALRSDRLREWFERLSEEARALAADPPLVGDLLELPGVLESGDDDADERAEALWPAVREALDRALDDWNDARDAEGARTAEVLAGHLDALSEHVATLRAGAPQVAAHYRERLLARLRDVLEQAGHAAEESDVVREAALLADRADISEELDRLDGHVTHFRELLEEDDDVGRRLEFVIQEMHREANTAASKAGTVDLGRTAVALKSEIEKLREQAANVE